MDDEELMEKVKARLSTVVRTLISAKKQLTE